MPDATDLNAATTRECFVVSPIGPDQSAIRKRADNVLLHVVAPAAEDHGLVAVRADELDAPGAITSQIIRRLLSSRAVVADLTGRNPNVYYELAVRDSFKRPVVLIAEEGTDLASDLVGQRTIFFRSDDLGSALGARAKISKALGHALAHPEEASPVHVAAQLEALEAGDAQQQAVGDLVAQVAALTQAVARFGDDVTIDPTPLGKLLADVPSRAYDDDPDRPVTDTD